jgi:hypothetical protein
MGKISSLPSRYQALAKGDEPFAPATVSRHEARLDMTTADFDGYALSYYEAAQKVIDASLLEFKHWPDLAFFPAAFLYRHYLELKLKQILLCWDREPKGHDLEKLWVDVRELVGRFWPNSEELEAAEKCILSFHTLWGQLCKP